MLTVPHTAMTLSYLNEILRNERASVPMLVSFAGFLVTVASMMYLATVIQREVSLVYSKYTCASILAIHRLVRRM